MESEAAKTFLRSLLNRSLHIYTTDNRMFVGEFKCTDNERNIILSSTHEYRLPAPPTAADFAASAGPSTSAAPAKLTKSLTPRFIGLVVVPGAHVVKIEVEGEGPWRGRLGDGVEGGEEG